MVYGVITVGFHILCFFSQWDVSAVAKELLGTGLLYKAAELAIRSAPNSFTGLKSEGLQNHCSHCKILKQDKQDTAGRLKNSWGSKEFLISRIKHPCSWITSVFWFQRLAEMTVAMQIAVPVFADWVSTCCLPRHSVLSSCSFTRWELTVCQEKRGEAYRADRPSGQIPGKSPVWWLDGVPSGNLT